MVVRGTPVSSDHSLEDRVNIPIQRRIKPV